MPVALLRVWGPYRTDNGGGLLSEVTVQFALELQRMMWKALYQIDHAIYSMDELSVYVSTSDPGSVNVKDFEVEFCPPLIGYGGDTPEQRRLRFAGMLESLWREYAPQLRAGNHQEPSIAFEVNPRDTAGFVLESLSEQSHTWGDDGITRPPASKDYADFLTSTVHYPWNK